MSANRQQRRRRCHVVDLSRSSRWQSARSWARSGCPAHRPHHPTGTDASEVTHWNQVATSTLGALPGPDGGAPPAFSINMGMVQGAVYDAVNAIGPKQHRPYLLDRRTGAKASIDAAVATAAYDVISRAGRHGTGAGAVPRSRRTAEHAVLRVRRLARVGRRRRVQEPGRRGGTRRGRGDAPRPRGRRAVRAVCVGAELRSRTLAAAPVRRPAHRCSTRPRGRAT